MEDEEPIEYDFGLDCPILVELRAVLYKNQSIFAFESCRDRPIYPVDRLLSRLSCKYKVDFKSGHLGPGSYDQNHGTMKNAMKSKIISNKGYLVRLDERSDPSKWTQLSDPGLYQNEVYVPPSPAARPFGSKIPRFKSDVKEGIPEVGYYNPETALRRRVDWQRDTMLRPVNLPKVDQKSTISINTQKLPSTNLSKDFARKKAYLTLHYGCDETTMPKYKEMMALQNDKRKSLRDICRM